MSTATIATILLLGVFLVLVFLRVPVVYAIGVASLLDFFYLGINPMQMALKFVSNLNSYTLLAVPFFILMGELMSAGGITDTLIAFSKELVGWMHGGAAMVNVVASFFFGGISGSSSADCASLGPIEIKMMEEQGSPRSGRAFPASGAAAQPRTAACPGGGKTGSAVPPCRLPARRAAPAGR